MRGKWLTSLSLQALCARGAQVLQSKSINVEDAANELISMLCDTHDDEERAEDEDGEGEAGETRGSTYRWKRPAMV